MFEAIKRETFIGKSVEPQEDVTRPEGYLNSEVIENAYRWQKEGGFVRSLLMIRFLDVLLKTKWYERLLFLESLIAAEDIHAFEQFFVSENEKPTLVFIGPKSRCDVYAHLFKHKLDWPHASLESIKAQVDNLKKSISSLRKSGKDVEIVSLKMLDVPYKIKVVEATKDPKDLNKLKDMILDIEKEIEEAKNKADDDLFSNADVEDENVNGDKKKT